MREPMAYRRSFPWRPLLSMVGAVLTIGGGLVAVSTPAAGGVVFGVGLLALVAGMAE